MHEGPKLYIGVDLGGTKIAVSLWADPGPGGSDPSDASDPSGPLLLDACRWETLPAGPTVNLDRIVGEARRLLASPAAGGRGTLAAVGISGGGPLDPEAGVILSVPNLPGWEGVPIGPRLSEALGAPARLENDANACAVAEWLYGAGRGARNLAFLTCSTGIGAGLILDGRLYRGSGLLAGEVGHQTIVPDGLRCGCGGRGCLEAYASGAGIARRLEALRSAGPVARAADGASRASEGIPRAPDAGFPSTAKDLVDRARRGDAFSVRFLAETADYLALGLANLIFVLNPDRIVLGTIVVGAGDLMLGPLRARLRERVWPELLEGLDVVPAALGPDLGNRAALAVARDLPGLLEPAGTGALTRVGARRTGRPECPTARTGPGDRTGCPEGGQEPSEGGQEPSGQRAASPPLPGEHPPASGAGRRGDRKSRPAGRLDPALHPGDGPDS